MFCFSRLQAPVSGMFAFHVKVTTLHKGLAVEVSLYKEGSAIDSASAADTDTRETGHAFLIVTVSFIICSH